MSRLARTAVLVFGALAVVLAVVLQLLAGIHDAADYADPAVLVPVFWSAGAVAFAYRPQLRCARWLCLAGTLIAVAHALAVLPAAAHAPSLWWVNLLSQVAFVGGFAAWAVVLVIFPDGRLETRAERVFVVLLPVAAVILPTAGFFSAARQPLIGAVSRPSTPVPIWTSALGPLHTAAEAIPASVLGGVLLLVLRYRRSAAARRAQLRLPLGAAALAALALVTSAPVSELLGETAQSYVFVLLVATLPVALLLGMIRGELFDIDRLVLRSLIYGVLWIVIAAVYASVAALFGLAAGHELALGPAVAIAILTAVLFQPARTRLERVADRWVYGDRLSDADAMRRLGDALQRAGDVHDIAAVVATTVRRGLGCEWTNVARPDGAFLAVDGTCPPKAAADLIVDVRHAGELVATIGCGRPRSTTGADRRLVEDLARQVAPALHNAELNRRLAEQLAELTASRARLVRAEERERRRIERDLHDGIQAQLVAVAAKVDLARLLHETRPEQVAHTLNELAAAVRHAHLDLREVVRGIHPAVLEDHGLVRAIEDRTAALPVTVTVTADAALRQRRLPVHLEGAAYFVAIEGLTNVMRHAGVATASVGLSRSVDELRVEIVDNGSGFRADAVTTHGLRGLADRLQALGGRLDVASTPGAGTTLVGVLPLDPAAEAGDD
ncbi:histidine kinase [uncultured Jatrophihabitans sp.]|uniref:sensor histidine kinase n=1 Tax=uncultured Jatrophihabitans sp. TaxID=1610747 RepID=UPI0035CAA84A